MPVWLVRKPRPASSVVSVEPGQVAALRGPRLLDGTDYGDVQPVVKRFVERHFGDAQRLGGTQDDRAVRRHEGGVEDEDGIRKAVVRGGDPLDLGARMLDVARQEVVLVGQPGGVQPPGVVPELRVGFERRGPRPAHREAAQGSHHAPDSETHGRALIVDLSATKGSKWRTTRQAQPTLTSRTSVPDS